jgi:hypothetical protein
MAVKGSIVAGGGIVACGGCGGVEFTPILFLWENSAAAKRTCYAEVKCVASSELANQTPDLESTSEMGHKD